MKEKANWSALVSSVGKRGEASKKEGQEIILSSISMILTSRKVVSKGNKKKFNK